MELLSNRSANVDDGVHSRGTEWAGPLRRTDATGPYLRTWALHADRAARWGSGQASGDPQWSPRLTAYDGGRHHGVESAWHWPAS